MKAAALPFIPVMPLAFKTPPPGAPLSSPSLLEGLRSSALWEAVADESERRLPRRRERIAEYRQFLAAGETTRIAEEVLAGRHRFLPPEIHAINRDGSARKKTVFAFGAADEFLLRSVNRLLAPVAEQALSPSCHSFRRGRGARTAFRALLRDPDLAAKACLRLDLADYFNSIPPERLLHSLPEPLAADDGVVVLLRSLLLDPRATAGGVETRVPRKGVMAGTPLAPLLSNLYLRDVDEHFAAARVTYARYSDDIAVFDEPTRLAEHRVWVEERVASLGLAINPAKSALALPGEPWEFLGLKYDRGTIDVAEHSSRKLRRRLHRLSRAYERSRRRRGHTADEAVRRFLRRLNRKLYGIGLGDADLCWTRWFFPVLTTDRTLRVLDRLVQEKTRFVATGRHRASDRRLMPYERARTLGYLPLAAAYHAWREAQERFERLVRRRTRADARRGSEVDMAPQP